MSFNELVQRACAEPTLVKALSWIAVYENDRAVKQAMRQEVGPDGAMWDTCFEFLFKEVMANYETLRAPESATASDCGCTRQ